MVYKSYLDFSKNNTVEASGSMKDNDEHKFLQLRDDNSDLMLIMNPQTLYMVVTCLYNELTDQQKEAFQEQMI